MRTRHKTLITVGVSALALTGTAFAVGATSDDDYSASLARRSTRASPRTSSCSSATAWGTPRSRSARYYGKGADGRLNMDRFAFRGSSIHYVLTPGPGPELPAQLRRRLGADRHGVVDRQQTQDGRLSQGPSPAGNVPGLQRRLPDLHGDRPRPRQGDRQRLHRRDHRRDAGRSERPHLPARLPGPGRRRAPPARRRPRRPGPGGLGSIAEQQVDQGFDLYLGGGSARYQQTLDAGGTDGRRLRAGQGLPVRHRHEGAARRVTTAPGGRRSSASSTPAT